MYFKITNKDEKHHNLQYKDGLIEDILPFVGNKNKSCCAGGIYFSDEENILKFCDFGVWIRVVEIPKGAKYVKDSSGDKWRANKLFFHPRKELFTLETFKWLETQGVNFHTESNLILNYLASRGHLELVKFIFEKGFTVSDSVFSPLDYAAMEGKLNVIKYLIEQGLDVTRGNYYALRSAITHGHLDVVKYLFEKGNTIEMVNHALDTCARNGYYETVQYLIDKGANINLLSGGQKLKLKFHTFINEFSKYILFSHKDF